MPEKNIALIRERQKFLLLFTKQLILHSQNKINELESMIKSESEYHSERPKQVQSPPIKTAPVQKNPIQEIKTGEEQIQNKSETIHEEEKEPMRKSIMSQGPPLQKEKNNISTIKPVNIKTSRKEVLSVPRRTPTRILRIPEPRLPPEFQHLRPTPMQREIDLGTLNPFIYDNAVRTIECLGPDKPIFVSGTMGRKPTTVTLSNKEVEGIIQKFSSASKIPIENGIYKVVVGRLVFSAIISDVVPSRFTIKKIAPTNPATMPRELNPNYNLFFGNRR